MLLTNYVHQAKYSFCSSYNSCNGQDGGGGGGGGHGGGVSCRSGSDSSSSMVVLVGTDIFHFTHACTFDH